MNYFNLYAISPIDGRYGKEILELKNIFSEYAFLKFRIIIEIRWLQKLFSIPEIVEINMFNYSDHKILNKIIKNFDYNDVNQIKILEKITRHDIKALEYFLKNKILYKVFHTSILSFIHFSCTSEDVNNLAYANMINTMRTKLLIPYWEKIIFTMQNMAINYKNISMMARTHGQPAISTTLGKEISNFYYRLYRQLLQLKKIKILGKINGAIGNCNAHLISYPILNWYYISKEFVNSFNIDWNYCTTQIEPHDYISEILSCIVRFNIILINFNQDIWKYISLKYFKQKNNIGESGSSTMPHKINPIDFEKSEGNLGLSNTMMNYMISKLPISRWQRDLTDSTVLRNFGSAMSYAIISYKSLLLGLNKITVNYHVIQKDLHYKWELLSEPIQIIMKKYGIHNSYETLKLLSKGKNINSMLIHQYIDTLKIPKREKIRLKTLTTQTYIGNAIRITKKIYNKII
ncbi:adenylosuccinate lyase [Buchnera aphidicola]|uniref:Adenylosuccinate lyase n=1 Tax=Buchnera aphidicola (Stegophylla sp.) TaxID=2315800 RepID=A0A4D6YL32_9GAMM|nr:adenylosuccinate lyase [Buchnera aphidicola (Stegophylla sp.)]QCI26348.1 adenylosuccinate lyase [Buchnera aphidicola (Stegophylla sp.)]